MDIKDSFLLIEPHSINRYILAKEKLMAHESHSIESFKEILSNHYDFPSGICLHSNQANDNDHKEETLSSIIMIPEKILFMYTQGPPCSNPYVSVSF